MYKKILVPVDNSEFSNHAIQVGIEIGKRYDSELTGNHVYAAKMHDYRFKQMEFTLPDEYLQETELERQRKIHDSLITMGLKLISDCYLNEMDEQCRDAGLSLEKKMMDGKHHVEILKDMAASCYDLTVIGIKGIGKTKDSQIGSVCQQVATNAKGDVWVVKHVEGENGSVRDSILVGIDGSPQSFGGLMTAIDLAKKMGKKLTLISVYDPYLHYMVFNGIVDVLTEKAAKVFRFEEQNQLHEEIIDTGLAQIYQSHLDVAGSMAKDEGLEVEKVLLDGKAYQKILDHIRKNPPWVLVMGRIGVHAENETAGLGSNSENLLRMAPCDVLLTSKQVYPKLDVKAEESISWTPEAENRMTRVPRLVKGIARTAILRLAVEQGHSVVTNSLIDEAMDRFMPKSAAEATKDLAETIAFEKASKGDAAICNHCGTTASEEDPVKCAICGERDFQKVTVEMVDKIIASEGGSKEESSYDGRKLRWTSDARGLLPAIQDNYQKRRAKAYIEKAARMRKLNAVTLEFAEKILTELGHEESIAEYAEKNDRDGGTVEEEEIHDSGLKLIVRDKGNVPLRSVFSWTDDAAERILRVPAGFMRDRVQGKVENMALDEKILEINLELVEKGISAGRQMMEEMLASAGLSKDSNGVDSSNGSNYKNGSDDKVDATPVYADISINDYPTNSPPKRMMNEEGVMSELDKKRSAL
ncbi:MAG: Light-independent protochlorophyllide reductase subunit B [Candidatus Moanabacter tarae]|uniref:Light-independent protochlorophyllide reductase subunit B n=1 Tax=Candidatus Moanibacter tarae TaxID=2200854 RepID=A0A2Z4ABG8_9BACT|nr:MAG: Light-independent protochlorophyllide reductase subunit B [Candidatus Moanabacter tarae]|tara:strand:- start:5002 stop:7098 length:2097 start_codon:yes stop_codon:yes gene_type:complete